MMRFSGIIYAVIDIQNLAIYDCTGHLPVFPGEMHHMTAGTFFPAAKLLN